MSMQQNLHNTELTDDDISELVCLLTHRCRAKMVRRVRSGLTYGLDCLPSWAKERLYKDDHGWQYCAGQDYPSELATIRGFFN